MIALLAAAVNLFAAGAEALAGESGWLGAGILGLVLSWLMFKHLPAKDAQLEKLINDKDRVVTQLIEKHDERIESLQETHKGAIDAVIAHCDKEMAEVVTRIAAELRGVKETVQGHAEENEAMHAQTRAQVTELAHAAQLKSLAEGGKWRKPAEPK